MDVLKQSTQRYLEIMGDNIPDPNKKHRFLNYLTFCDIDNGKAIHNNLTGSFIWIPYDQFNNIFNDEVKDHDYIDFLWKNYFIVNEDYNEQICQQNLKDMFRKSIDDDNYLKSGHIHEYTIYTTMACNARCAYCYEKGRPTPPMKAETARKVANYIIKTAEKNGNEISLRWFGGEPLVNENIVDIICKEVKDAGFNYSSSFTTNGFLLKEEKIKKYKDLWHFKGCQITLDGTEEFYNKIKNYKNVKGKNPYQIVLNNIKFLLDNEISVNIRMNMDINNAENIKELIKELYNNFGNRKFLSVYAYPIFEDHDNPRTDKENAELYKKLEEIDAILDQYGYFSPNTCSNFVRSTHCMIDNGYAVVIGTNGDIGLCEHYSDEHFWGHVDKPEMKNINEIQAFHEYMPDYDMCKTCPILPDCIRPKLCVDLRDCNKFKKNWQIRNSVQSAKILYWNIRRNMNSEFVSVYENTQCNNENNEQIKELSFWEKLKIKIGLK